MPSESENVISSEEALKLYWKSFFPFHQMYQWLSYGNNELFYKREFNFTAGELYIRFKSYQDENKWRQAILKMPDIPQKMDIGAIYNIPPMERDSFTTLIPNQREFIFDIDLTDYDEFRTCCTGANICQKCWYFIAIAIQSLDSLLREEFGFEHFFFVYSGRRGCHCWVSDEEARNLSEEARTSLLEFISILPQAKGMHHIGELHPTFERIYEEILLPSFEKYILVNQKILDGRENWTKVLEFIPDAKLKESDKSLRQKIESLWEKGNPSPLQRWEDLKFNITKYSQKTIISDIVFHYTFPRLDIAVSKGIGHLLKAPFSPHPSTNRICVPVFPSSCFEFNPLNVPTTMDLFNTMGSSNPLTPFIKKWENEFLKPLEKVNRSLNQNTQDW